MRRALVVASLVTLFPGCPPTSNSGTGGQPGNSSTPGDGAAPDDAPAGGGTRGLTVEKRTQPTGGLELGAYHALVIGNDAYQHHPPLKTAVQDAQDVARVLEADYGFTVRLLTDGTSKAMLDALWSYRDALTEGDNLLIYYAGHGYQDDRAQQSYWFPVDATDTPTEWISNATIAEVLRPLPARHVMIVSDSCYSGSLTRGISIQDEAADDLQRMTQKRARVVLTSGGLAPVSDAGGGRNSVFARKFLDALGENTGVLDGHALFARIRRPVMLAADQTPEYGDIRKCGHDGGDFLFARKVALDGAVAGDGGSGAEAIPVPTPAQPAPDQADPAPEAGPLSDAEKRAEAEARKAEQEAAELPRKLAALEAEQAAAPKASGSADQVHGCPMHPQVMEDHPRTCPICGLPLKQIEAPGAEQEAVKQAGGPVHAGFTYLREESFSCGGQTHTVKVYRHEAFAKALELDAGQTDVACEFVLVPGGRFTMGSQDGESDERPPHQVSVQPFLLARTEVSQAVWKVVMGETPAHFKGDRRPVETVAWEEARAFCQKTGLRLPSEAEWEYACRARTTGRFTSGERDGDLGAVAWFGGNSGNTTHPVGSKQANAFGLFDVHGNVWEWVEDSYQDGYSGAPGDGSAWNPTGASLRVFRGGGWVLSARLCRSANRSRDSPGYRSLVLGFRPAR